MRVVVQGEENGRPVSHTWDLFDEYCPETGTSSMARTTGYACTAAVNAVASGLYARKGLSPAEFLGRNEDCFEYMLDYLKKRGVIYSKKTEEF